MQTDNPGIGLQNLTIQLLQTHFIEDMAQQPKLNPGPYTAATRLSNEIESPVRPGVPCLNISQGDHSQRRALTENHIDPVSVRPPQALKPCGVLSLGNQMVVVHVDANVILVAELTDLPLNRLSRIQNVHELQIFARFGRDGVDGLMNVPAITSSSLGIAAKVEHTPDHPISPGAINQPGRDRRLRPPPLRVLRQCHQCTGDSIDRQMFEFPEIDAASKPAKRTSPSFWAAKIIGTPNIDISHTVEPAAESAISHH